MKTYKEFFQYVLPSMLAFALSGVYAIADGFFVGNAMGDTALAAINVAYPLTALLQAIGTGLGMGGAIRYAISMGSHDEKRGKRYFGMACILLAISAIGLTVIYLFSTSILLPMLGASGEIEIYANEYMLYITLGAAFQILGCGIVPFIRNMGSSILAMSSMIAGFLTNIILDYLFVWVFPWGMMGAAIATVAGQAVTLIVCVFFLWRKQMLPVFHFEGKAKIYMKETIQVGLSPFGLTFSPNITLVLMNKSLAFYGGSVAVTCFAPISYVSSIILLLLQGVSDGAQPLLSLSYGEGKNEKVKKVRNIAYVFALIIGLLCMIVLFLFRSDIALLFGASYATSQQVAQLLPLFLSGYLCICISRVTTAYFYATNQNLIAYLLIYGEPLGLLALLLALPNLFELIGVWIAIPCSQLFAMLFSGLLLWLSFYQKTRKVKETGNVIKK